MQEPVTVYWSGYRFRDSNIATGVTTDVCAGQPFTRMAGTVHCETGSSCTADMVLRRHDLLRSMHLRRRERRSGRSEQLRRLRASTARPLPSATTTARRARTPARFPRSPLVHPRPARGSGTELHPVRQEPERRLYRHGSGHRPARHRREPRQREPPAPIAELLLRVPRPGELHQQLHSAGGLRSGVRGPGDRVRRWHVTEPDARAGLPRRAELRAGSPAIRHPRHDRYAEHARRRDLRNSSCWLGGRRHH